MTDLPIAVVRGGTSKGVFVHLDLLPGDPGVRDALLLRLMGSPDPMQLDGLGGTHSSTSKVMAVGRSDEPGVDVEYLFAQVGIAEPIIELTGNCGNLTAAVGPFAVDEGLTGQTDGLRELVLLNLNTGVRIRSRFEIAGGRAVEEGDCVIAGVPGAGAPVVTDYLDPAGSVTGKLFPTGSRRDRVAGCDVSIVDVASPHAFVRAADIGLTGSESPDELNAQPDVLDRVEEIRSAAAARIGLQSAAIPRMVLVSTPASDDAHLVIRASSMQKIHHASPMTAALCTGAASRLAGTIAYEAAVDDGIGPVRIRHPKGMVEITVEVDGVHVRSTGVVRTVRRLLTGTAHVPIPTPNHDPEPSR